MSVSLVKADSLLAIDVGTINTRVSLFDVVDARYRYLGSGVAPTTINAPFNDINEGINQAIESLQVITGRVLLTEEAQLITPEKVDGSGVDLVAATISAYAPVKVIVSGLLEDISTESAFRLARSISSIILERFGLNDHLTSQERLNSIIQSQPDLVIVAGGSERGAENAVLKIIDTVGLACYLLPENHQPKVLFVGNSQLSEKLKQTPLIGQTIRIAPNIHPTIDVEQLQPAQGELIEVFRSIQTREIGGFSLLDTWTKGTTIPASFGWERVVRLLSTIYDSQKGVLGVDVSTSGICLAAGFGGETRLAVYPEFGLIHPFNNLNINEIKKWLIHDLSSTEIQDRLQNRALYPAAIPMTAEDLDLEQANAVVQLQNSLQQFLPQISSIAKTKEPDWLPGVEPIIVSGSIFTNSNNLAQTGLTILNGVQPTGITTLVLDQHHLIKVLGAAAAVNPVLAIQAMDFGTLLNLASVITPLGHAKPGTLILKAKINYADGREQKLDVRYGQLICLLLAPGQAMEMHLQPFHKFDIGMGGEGVGGKVRLNGSALGVIIDARGRPLHFPQDMNKRRELNQRWLLTLEKR